MKSYSPSPSPNAGIGFAKVLVRCFVIVSLLFACSKDVSETYIRFAP